MSQGLLEVQLLRLTGPDGILRWYMPERQIEQLLCMGYNADVKKAWSLSEYIAVTPETQQLLRSAQQERRAARQGGKGA